MGQSTAEQQQYIKMTATPVSRLITGLAVPTIISMLVTSIYNMADTFFVSQISTSATGAVGVVFSLMAMIQAIGFTLGFGAGGQCARLLGQKHHEEANIIASTSFFTSLALGLLFTVAGLFFLTPLMKLLGATPTILPYASDYAEYILFGAPFMCASFVMNNLLRSQGRASLSMIGLTTGGILNILLDPLFIFGLKMGISGAALATLLSQCVSFLLLLSFFLRGKSIIHLSPKFISRQGYIYSGIIRTGFPSFCRQGLASLATVALNIAASGFGDSAVAAMSVVTRIFMFILSVMIGLGQGFQPVVGYNYGAKKYGRVRQACRFTFLAGLCMLTALALIGFIFAPQIMASFRKGDAAVIEIGTTAFRAQCLVLPLHALIVVSSMLFQVIGKARQATVISAARQGIFFLPLIYLLPQLMGLAGVQYTQPIADFLSSLLAIPLLAVFFRELDKLEQQEEELPAEAPEEAG